MTTNQRAQSLCSCFPTQRNKATVPAETPYISFCTSLCLPAVVATWTALPLALGVSVTATVTSVMADLSTIFHNIRILFQTTLSLLLFHIQALHLPPNIATLP